MLLLKKTIIVHAVSGDYSNEQLEISGVTVLNHEMPKLRRTNSSKPTFIPREL